VAVQARFILTPACFVCVACVQQQAPPEEELLPTESGLREVVRVVLTSVLSDLAVS
jgi:hypothetical protein